MQRKRVRRHVYNVNRAMTALTKRLDHFEMVCVKNGLRLKLIRYGPKVRTSNDPKSLTGFEHSGLVINAVPLR